MKKALLSIFLCTASIAFAVETEGNPAFVNSVRVHTPNNRAYIDVSTASFGTSTFSIDLSVNNAVGRDQLAAVLMAITTNKQVMVTVDETCLPSSCTWGTPIKSVYLYRSRN